AQISTNVLIEGHTDASGDGSENRELSQARADAVLRYLTHKGIDGARLTAVGFGESRPIQDNGTEEGKRANRRIEFKTAPDAPDHTERP
ncbi:MAG: OmpA family protein, partial [Longimicrobiales bacterium]